MSYQNQAGSKERGRTTESGEPLKIGALWRRRSRKGVEYWAGIINEQRVIVFKVREKRSDKSPDYEFSSPTGRQPKAARTRPSEKWRRSSNSTPRQASRRHTPPTLRIC